MGNHARLSPSSSKRWMTCPASVAREEGLPDSDSPSSLWGTAAHEALALALEASTRASEETVQVIYDAMAPETQKVGDILDMVNAINVAFDYITGTVRDRHPAALRVETKVDAGLLIGRNDSNGTADAIVADHVVLEVADFKSGKGVIVEPDDPQLRNYALGALGQYNLMDGSCPFEKVRCTIIQPRVEGHPGGPIRSVEYTIEEMLAWMTNEFAPRAAATDDPNAPAIPEDDACRFCKVKTTCLELSNKVLNAATCVFQPIEGSQELVPATARTDLADKLVRDPAVLGMDELRFILDHDQLISGWLKAVRDHGTKLMKAGTPVPGYKMVAGKGSRAYSGTDEEVIKATSGLKKSDGKRLGRTGMLEEAKVMSPAQAEKRIKPLLPAATWKKVNALITKSSGAPTLAPETDSRPALVTQAKDMFQPIADQDAAAVTNQEPGDVDLSFLD